MYANLPFHPLSEQLIDLMQVKTQSSNKEFFRVLVPYYWALAASTMHAKIVGFDSNPILINFYGVNLAQSGTGKGIKGGLQYSVAGKTGTAQKLRADRKGYSQSDYRALFAGVAPVSDPRLAMIVVVENPKGQYYGGLVAAPVFARVMQESLRLMNVPLDKPLDAPKVQ